jgi:UDP-glucuronate 4-epimerase
MDFIETLEKKTNIDAKKNFLPIQPGDVLVTDADCSDLEEKINFTPQISIEDGLSNFINWYRDYYKI